MDVLLLYFSQTGNTKKVTDQIAQGIRSKKGRCTISPLKGFDTSRLQEYDLVGLGFPVFYYKEPFNVRDFMESLPPLSQQHWFIYVTHANAIGETLPLASKRLQEKGAIVVGYSNTYADTTVPFYPKPLYLHGHPDETSLREAIEFGEEVVELSERIEGPDSELIPEPYPVSSMYFKEQSKKLTPEYVSKIMPHYSIDKERCIECGSCMDGCPVDGIDVFSDPPRIQDPCIHCWRCVNVCPTLAIEADWSMLIDNAPYEFKHYRRELEMAEARGEFRWHIDPDTIDFSDPWIKQRERSLKKR